MEKNDKNELTYNNNEDIYKRDRQFKRSLSLNKSQNCYEKNKLQNNFSVDIKNVKKLPSYNILFNEKEEKKDYSTNNNTLGDLIELKIDNSILEGIYNNKHLLIRNMKQKDRHGDGLITKFDFLSIFHKTNCHYKLRIEFIKKIVGIYLNNINAIMIYYVNLINALCQDIKIIIDRKYNSNYINKYIPLSQNIFLRENNCFKKTRNFNNNSISSLNTFHDLPCIDEFNVKEIINKINKISSELLVQYSEKDISVINLISILEKKGIYLNKTQAIQLLNYLGIQNSNLFNFNEFLEKIKTNSNYLLNTISNKRSFRINNIKKFNDNNRYNKIINSGFETIRNKQLFYPKNISEDKKHKINNIKLYKSINKNNINKENKKNDGEKEFCYNQEELKNNEIVVNCIKLLQNKIYEYEYRLELISEYFDTLLSYNIFRLDNIILPSEFEKALNQENFNFNKKEIDLLFSYIDNKKDGFIDRIEFIDAIKNVPYPISSIQNYILRNNLSINDLAYKMDFDLYFIPINEILDKKISLIDFQGKMKLINPKFNNDFSRALFKEINGKEKEIKIQKIFEIFNVKKDFSYEELYNKRNEISNKYIQAVFNNTTYFDLKDKLYSLDITKIYKIPLYLFMKTINELIKGKLSDSDLIHFLRMYKLIDRENNVDYTKFIRLIFLNNDDTDEVWYKCLQTLMNFIKEECNNDLYIFIFKLNNINTNVLMKQSIDENKLYEFIKTRNNFITFPKSVIKKFDYDNDGKITEDDLKNIIINYADKDFFVDKKKKEDENKKLYENQIFEENYKHYIYLLNILNKNNLTLDKFFYYLDANKDNYIHLNEFINQMNFLPYLDNTKFVREKMEQFFDYLDEFKINKIDYNTFINRLNILDDHRKLNKKLIYKGNPNIEKLLLNEFAKYYLKHNNISDNELFTLLDNDHDGIVSKEDLRTFCIEILNMNRDELTFDVLLHFIISISENKEESLNFCDIQKFINDIKNNDLNKYMKIFDNFCNEAINLKNINNDWIKDIVDIIGMYISQEYDGNIEEFYNSLNKTNLTNKGQGLSFNNFLHFFETNYLLIEAFHMNNDKYLVLFNHLSNNNKFITLDNLRNTFKNYDFYECMHKYISNFLKNNFKSSLEAFEYFFQINNLKNEKKTSNKLFNRNYITKKEFFEGILNIFPNKFKINTIYKYYNKFIKTTDSRKLNSSIDEKKDIIKFNEFNTIFFNEIIKSDKYTLTLDFQSKNKNNRNKNNFLTTIKFPFKVRINPKLKTIYDIEPLNKIRKLIHSSKINFKDEFHKLMKKTDGKANIFQIKNMIKRLGLGLTNIEIEDILHKSGLLSEGYINLIDFYHYITSESQVKFIYKRNITESLKDLKQLIIKYYTNPLLAFELNDTSNKKIIDFETFKNIILDLYKRELRTFSSPPYSLIKSMYDYIDIRKDGIIDMNEWCKIFCDIKGRLDVENNKNNNLRKWEMSQNIFEIYKLISKNDKIIREKMKENSISENYTVIHEDNLIKILKEIMPKIHLNHSQWRMIVSIGEEIGLGLINYETFIKIVKMSSRISNSQMK